MIEIEGEGSLKEREKIVEKENVTYHKLTILSPYSIEALKGIIFRPNN